MMNGLYIQAVIEDRQREVEKHSEYNQIYKHFRDSAASKRESAEQGKNELSRWLSTVAKRLKDVLTVINEDSVKV